MRQRASSGSFVEPSSRVGQFLSGNLTPASKRAAPAPARAAAAATPAARAERDAIAAARVAAAAAARDASDALRAARRRVDAIVAMAAEIPSTSCCVFIIRMLMGR